MNYNPRMGFNEQDYHLLKTHQSSGDSSAIKQESLKNISQISFDNQHNYMFDIACDCYLGGDFSFGASSGCTVSKVGSANPTTVGNVSRMIITVATNTDTATRGQIVWNEVRWNIATTSGNSWTITLPNGYFFNGVKTEAGDPGEIL